jgi:hypothetical protein
MCLLIINTHAKHLSASQNFERACVQQANTRKQKLAKLGERLDVKSKKWNQHCNETNSGTVAF